MAFAHCKSADELHLRNRVRVTETRNYSGLFASRLPRDALDGARGVLAHERLGRLGEGLELCEGSLQLHDSRLVDANLAHVGGELRAEAAEQRQVDYLLLLKAADQVAEPEAARWFAEAAEQGGEYGEAATLELAELQST